MSQDCMLLAAALLLRGALSLVQLINPHNSLADTCDAAGGAESILIVAGADATDDFNAIHSARAKGMLKQYVIGRVGESTGGQGKPEQAPVDKEVSP